MNKNIWVCSNQWKYSVSSSTTNLRRALAPILKNATNNLERKITISAAKTSSQHNRPTQEWKIFSIQTMELSYDWKNSLHVTRAMQSAENKHGTSCSPPKQSFSLLPDKNKNLLNEKHKTKSTASKKIPTSQSELRIESKSFSQLTEK